MHVGGHQAAVQLLVAFWRKWEDKTGRSCGSQKLHQIVEEERKDMHAELGVSSALKTNFNVSRKVQVRQCSNSDLTRSKWGREICHWMGRCYNFSTVLQQRSFIEGPEFVCWRDKQQKRRQNSFVNIIFPQSVARYIIFNRFLVTSLWKEEKQSCSAFLIQLSFLLLFYSDWTW